MESTKEQSGMLHQILPPRIEDAGLEDPALPPESIHEAFLKAAAAVKSRAASIFSSDGGCVTDPWPTAEDASDEVVGIQLENEPPGSCTVDRGLEAVADEVKVAGGGDGVGTEDLVVKGGVKSGEDTEACVDELRDLGIKDVKKGDEVGKGNDDEQEENKKPTLVEGYA